MSETFPIPVQPWMTTPAVTRLFEVLSPEADMLRFVGGCVRNTLMQQPVGDIDLATSLTPDVVKARLAAAQIKTVDVGISHGTVLAVVDGQPFEVTTLRRDVKTDGRHAEVAFTTDWAEDAQRRDFTINALYARPDGTVYDPVGGRPDIDARRVRFIGAADQRLREDVLRLLRFFRFHTLYGDGPPDPEGLAACTARAPDLPRLSGERVRVELLKLLAAPDPAPAWKIMVERGILAHLHQDLQTSPTRIEALAALVTLERAWDLPPDPLRRLAVCLPSPAIATRLKLSREETRRLTVMLGTPWPQDMTVALHRLGQDTCRDLMLLHAARTDAAISAEDWEILMHWQPIPFPVTGHDLKAMGLTDGPAIGQLLRKTEDWWLAQNREPDKAACLAYITCRAHAP